MDIERFDKWVAVNDDDVEANELAKIVVETLVLTSALLGPAMAETLALAVVQTSLKAAYGSVEGHEAQAMLELGDPISALEQLFDDVDMLTFEFAQRANGLKCYAMTGMIEDELPSHTFEEKRNHLSDLIAWARMICDMIPQERIALTSFRNISEAAEARYSLDLDLPVDTASFACLAAFFREGTPEQVRKTLQNQISAKQLSVNERRQLFPTSAFQFLKGTPGFPSIWMLADDVQEDADAVTEPTFIPVSPAIFSAEDRPFLPSERHADGYHVGAGESARTIEDYWDALDWLAQSAEPAYQPAGQDTPVRCKSNWLRIDRRLLVNELNAITPMASSTKSLTDQLHQWLLTNSTYRVHPIGHSSKAYRYRRDDGAELALEKRIGEPWLHSLSTTLPIVDGVHHADVVETNHGRNSSLNAIPTFKEQPLRKYRLTSVADLRAVIGSH